MLAATTTALVYTRVSTDEQASEGYSLDAQLAEARRYAARQQWIIGTEFQDVLSGKRDDRPQYQSLLEEVRHLRARGQSVTVVVAALDRFGRSILERIRSREELKRLGVATHSVREGGEVSDLVANILASVAQEESRRLGERVLASRDHLASRGWKPSGRAPWGFVWRMANDDERQQGSPAKVLDIDPITAPYVREAFRRAATSESVQAVARWIASLPGAARGDRNLRYCAVRSVLSAAVYVGRTDDRNQPDVLARSHGRWPALVDDTTYSAVQARIAGHRKMARQASGRFLLTGLIRCVCGSRMTGSAMTGRTVRYCCTGYLNGAAEFANVDCRSSVHAGQLDTGVIDRVAALIAPLASNDSKLRAALRRAWADLETPADSTGEVQRRRALERIIEQARARLTTAATLLVDGSIDKTGYELLRDKSQADLQAAEDELSRLGDVRVDEALPALDEVLSMAGEWSEVIATGSIPAKRDLLAVLIAKVTPERIGWGKYIPQIEWTARGAALAGAAKQAQNVA